MFYTQPIISEVDSFYWEAFHDLSTERQIGMGLGPIPRSAIMDYANESGLSSDSAEKFARIIRDLDIEFLRTANATSSKDKNEPELVSVTDVEGTKQMLARLQARANSVKGKAPPNGKP